MRSDSVGISRRDALMLGGAASLSAAIAGMVPAAARAGSTVSGAKPIDILFAVYPAGTLLDVAGPNEVFTRMPNTRVRYASPAGGTVTLENGVQFGPTERLADISNTDVICVPGGPNLSAMMTPEMLGHVRRLSDAARYVTSVCTGSIILAASGVLKGKRSACHWACLNVLKEYGAIPDPGRIVKDGRFMSGGGITAGIDFALALSAELHGIQAAEEVELLIQYSPEPPFRSGHPSEAPKAVRDAVYQRLPGSSEGLLRLTL